MSLRLSIERKKKDPNEVELATLSYRDCFEKGGTLHMVVKPIFSQESSMMYLNEAEHAVPVVNLASGTVWNCQGKTKVQLVSGVELSYGYKRS